MNPEDPKLNETNIGLLNLSEENGGGISKIKLQMSEVGSYSFYEGEIVVVEGTYDSTQSKLNVIAVHKPSIEALPRRTVSFQELEKFSKEAYNGKQLQILAAAGPFTFKSSVQYQGLHDFLAIVRKESPHAVILMGPFVDSNNAEIQSGDLQFEINNIKSFVSHEELFRDLLNTIQKEL